jgi:glycosyltransferase involved in cell wall biosynthesis
LKIAYVAFLNHVEQPGVFKKLTTQVRSWNSSAVEAKLFLFSSNRERPHGLSREELQFYSSGSKLKKLFLLRRFSADVVAWNPDVAYFRFGLYYPFLKTIFKKVPTVTEVNTNDLQEFKYFSHHKSNYYYHLATRHHILNNVRGIIAVTNELKSIYCRYNDRIITSSNGLKLSDFPVDPAPSKINEGIKLVFIGLPDCEWHGIERIAELADLFPRWEFHIIGYSRHHVKRPIPSNFILHGLLDKRDYMEIMADCAVAIGPMALYKNRMNEACPLKVREYLAFGLPVIIAYDDTDFPENPDFLFKLPNSSVRLDGYKEQISGFVEKWGKARVPRDRLSSIDIFEKNAKLFEFFKNIH